MIKAYLTRIFQTAIRGDAREESYYPALSEFMVLLGKSLGRTNTQVTILPKKTAAGNPDFRIWDGREKIIGYIEAKRPGENLDYSERSTQLERYRSIFPNLILTDFFEFRIYRNGTYVERVILARPGLAKKGIEPPAENIDLFKKFISLFFSFSLPAITTASQLASELAVRTRFLRDEVIVMEMEQQRLEKGELYGFYETFCKYLISRLTETEFADLFAQTITYGLFAARTRSANGFNRKLAYHLIPKTIGILRNVFRFVSHADLPPHMEVMIDDIAEVLNAANVKNILHQYYKTGMGDDPVVHFYETFLGAYDQKTREKRGVYYTPEAIVKFIIRTVHKILKNQFSFHDGLANQDVTLLDPAAGTLTFAAEAIRVAVNEYKDKYGTGGINNLIAGHILENFIAFELMMAPYAIGHIKISILLEELGYVIPDSKRFRLYLTNTLDMEDLSQTNIPGLESLSDESHEAGKVKKNEPVLVIVGNPPYSGISANINEWTEHLMKTNLDGVQSYYEIDGSKLLERKLWLQDDYVKFIRFSQWKIHKAGKGIVGMITNHSYLDNPTFRGMRQSLMKTFNEIYIVDLHGNSIKKEKGPDGEKDTNVFDIQQGVAISIFIKNPELHGCKIMHQDVFGERKKKYSWLDNNELNSQNFNKVTPESPWYFFCPRDTSGIVYYNQWIKISEIFPVNVTGIVTARDHFAIDFSRKSLESRIRLFRNISVDNDTIRATFHLKDTRGWKLPEARMNLARESQWQDHFHNILYRPFDIREIYYSPQTVDWGRQEIMKNMLLPNLSICFVRQYSGQKTYSHALISKYMVDNRTFFSSKGIIQQAPLYIYDEDQRRRKQPFQVMMLLEPDHEYVTMKRRPNISSKVLQLLEDRYKKKPTPEQILYYCYAVLYSNKYRMSYSEFLKFDFPKIPFPLGFDIFNHMASLGEELAQLHLLDSTYLERPVVKCFGTGEDTIEKLTYDPVDKTLFINKHKYFDGITPEIWQYQVGGYQVLEKFLKDRKGQSMSDPATFCKISSALHYTMKTQEAIDQIFPIIEKENHDIALLPASPKI